ncbi:hypothetical protein G6L99_19075 [Agrobacterium rhizogenes]|nr:hypothetical protein [Rhizobium rhizogenes]
MTEDEIPAFVAAEAGCDICAVGRGGYVLGDVDLSSYAYERALPKPEAIDERFGDRGHLLHEIVAYLRSLGRYLDLDSQEAGQAH